MADAVRRISQNSPDDIFPNGAGSEQVIGLLAGDDHMNLRKLQAAIERVGRMPPTPLVEITDLTLLVQFLNVTYGAEEQDEDGSLDRSRNLDDLLKMGASQCDKLCPTRRVSNAGRPLKRRDSSSAFRHLDHSARTILLWRAGVWSRLQQLSKTHRVLRETLNSSSSS